MTEERCAKGRERTEPPARANQTGPVHRAAERQDLRTRIVRRGVRAVCGPSTAIPTSAAANIPLFSASLRFAWLKVLGAAGIRNFVTTSGLGFDFVCHVGDLSEHPFYHRRAYESELALCAAWLHDENEPVVFDIGANVGFVSTQLAQMLAARSPTIYAFEPVPTTFAKLVQSVHRLGLNDRVHPIAAAVLDDPRQVCLSYSLRNSLYAQITPHGLNPRVGDHLAYAPGVTLDGFCSLVDVRPALLKIDVEGSEVAVLRGAPRLLARRDRPAILLEYNPVTLSECGANGRSLGELLSGYALHYVDDLEGQIMSFGSPVSHIDEITWICNLFAVPLALTTSTARDPASSAATGRSGPGQPLLGADRFHQSANAENAHHPFHIVGQDVQRHLGADVLQRFHLEVRRSHPRLYREPRAAIGIFCKPSLSSGSSAAECPRFDVDQLRLSH